MINLLKKKTKAQGTEIHTQFKIKPMLSYHLNLKYDIQAKSYNRNGI